MSDPLHPRSSPSSKPENQETDGTETINVTYKKQNRVQNFLIGSLILRDKYSSIKGKEEIINPQISRLNQIQSESTRNMSNQDCQKPSFLSKLRSFIRLPSFVRGIFGSKMSDKQPGRPMKYPYTLSAKIAQFPIKYYVKNNWMWKYYLIAIGVTFPLFYKIARASNTPENKKVWDDIRRKEFTPGGHH